MGCDIHLHVEIKVDDQWSHYNHPSVQRRYNLFGKMVGVRNPDTDPVSTVKGFPDDANLTTELDYNEWGGDAHHASWMSIEEIDKLSKWYDPLPGESEFEGIFGYLFGNSFSGFLKYRDSYPEWLQDVRFVFWFDN